jgi:hypothetical protein
MQLVSVGVFSPNGDRRDVEFHLGALNILTGKSKTGKSAVLDIVEYCLGRNEFTVPQGVITENVAWYYLIVQISEERILLCRPNITGASTTRAMVRTGGIDLEPPAFEELESNADTDVIREMLDERLEVEAFTIDSNAHSLRSGFSASVRQALLFCFQKQGEIANRDLLFHRQADSQLAGVIRDSLPYFLGAATPEQATMRRELVTARRSLRRIELDIKAAVAALVSVDTRTMRLVETGIALGVLSESARLEVRSNPRAVLESIATYRLPLDLGSAPEISHERSDLLRSVKDLRAQLRDLDGQVDVLRSLQREAALSSVESRYQVERLRAVELFGSTGPEEGDLHSCPLCSQAMSQEDESVAELQAALGSFNRRMAFSQHAASRRDDAIAQLLTNRVELSTSLRSSLVRLEVLAAEDSLEADGAELRERIAHLQGRVAQELERGFESADELVLLKESERRTRGQIARLEELYEANDPVEELERALEGVSDILTDFSRALRLEGADGRVRFDANKLTVVVQRPGGRVPLSRMGSAENWVGYHLAAHLALHHWFVTNERPVPRFLMFDQPTQAFFPEEIVDASDDENADWEAVRRQFLLMRDVVDALNGGLQVIVCDHANLADGWFQDSIVDNWRNGTALVPVDWIAE